MSGKGNASNNKGGGSGGSGSASSGYAAASSSSSGSGGSGSSSGPSIIQGWEHSTYAHATTEYAAQRYAYIGKDDSSGEPMWLDYGPKGGK